MSEHTKGRLAVKGEWIIPEAHADRMIGSSTNKADDKSNYAHTVAIVRGKYQDDKANARRLAACWNMFLDIDTDVIEIMPTFIEFQQSYEQTLHETLCELNAARALLREVLEAGFSVMPIDFSRNPSSLESRVSAYLDACDKPGEKNAS